MIDGAGHILLNNHVRTLLEVPANRAWETVPVLFGVWGSGLCVRV